MKTYIRPTNMAAAFVAAAISSPSTLGQVVIDRALSDDEKAPLKSGYNRAEHDGIRVSNTTLGRMNRITRL